MSYEATLNLFEAIAKKSLTQVKYALEEADIEGRNPHEGHVTPLYYASRMKAYDIVDFLLSEKAMSHSVSSTMQHDFTFAFAMEGGSDTIDHLISLHKKHQFALTGQDKYQNDLVQISISRDSEKLFNYLCKKNIANMKHRDFQGNNYLHDALKSNNHFFTEALLTMPDSKYLLEETEMGSPLHLCAEKYPQHLSSFLQHPDIVIDAVDQSGNTALLMAVKYGNLTSLRILLEAGADPNIPDADGNTALIHCAQKNFISSTELLLQYGAQTDYMNPEKETAAYLAKQANHPNVLDLILKHQQKNKKKVIRKAQKTLQNCNIPTKPITLRRRPKP